MAQGPGGGLCHARPQHHQLTHASGRQQAIADLGLAVGQSRRFAQCQVDEVWGRVWVKALTYRDCLFLFGNVGRPCMGQLYARRWTIEQYFQNLKGRVFCL